MVHVEFWRPGSESANPSVSPRSHSTDAHSLIEGREPLLVDLERVVLSISTGEAILGRMTQKSGHAA